QDYEKAADNFRQQGDFENEAKALRVAHEIERAEVNEIGRRQVAQMQAGFNNDMVSMMQQYEELRTPGHPMTDTLQEVLDAYPMLEAVPGGFQEAVKWAQILLEARAASELREAYAEERARREAYEKKAQPLRGGPTVPSASPKDWDSMSPEEKDR